jgi:hypothetical protein
MIPQKRSLSLRDNGVASRSPLIPWVTIESLPSMHYRRARSTALCSNGKHRVNKWLTPLLAPSDKGTSGGDSETQKIKAQRFTHFISEGERAS